MYCVEDLPPGLASRIVVNPVTGCWEWQHKSGPDPDRYGQVLWEGRLQPAHRVVYTALAGPIPEDRPQLDHVYIWGCQAKSCCWPAHLEPVTKVENIIRSRYANRVNGVARTVLKRIAAGVPNERDLVLAEWLRKSA